MRQSWTTLGVLATCVAVAAIAQAEDARVWKLTRHSPAVGDAFHAEVTTTIRHGILGKPLRSSVSSKLAYNCLVLSKNEATGRFEARLEFEPQTTTSEEDGVAPTTTTTRGVTIQQEMTAEELSFVPVLKDKSGADLAAGRSELKLGESWTSEKLVPVTEETDIPVTGTYKVASVEKGAAGRELVKIEFSSSGTGTVGKNKLTVKSHGHALLDPTRAERPVEVRLFYSFVAEGDGSDGPGAESQSEVTIHTNEVTK